MTSPLNQVVFDSLAPWIEAIQSTEAALLSTGHGGERHYTSLYCLHFGRHLLHRLIIFAAETGTIT